MIFKLDIRTVVVLAAILFVVPTHAQALEDRKHMATLGIETEYHHYEEEGLMKETGWLSGLHGAYTYHGKLLSESLPAGMARLEGRILFGKVNYDGHLSNGTPYQIDDVQDFTSEFRGVVGYDFGDKAGTTITPYLGLGYRYLKDDSSDDNAGYRRHSNYFYTPIGIETRTKFADSWSGGVVLEFDRFWFGHQETSLSDLDPLYSDLENDQDEGYGFRGSIKIRKEMDDKNFIFEPYVHYWKIADSDLSNVYYNGVHVANGYEPENTTTEIGMKFGVEF